MSTNEHNMQKPILFLTGSNSSHAYNIIHFDLTNCFDHTSKELNSIHAGTKAGTSFQILLGVQTKQAKDFAWTADV